MKLRNLIKENPNYVEDAKIASIGNRMDTADSNKYDWLIEFRVQKLFIEPRLKVVINITPQEVLSFAKSEIQNIDRFLKNELGKLERSIFCNDLGVSEYIDINKKNWQVDELTQYKKYLEIFIADEGILESKEAAQDEDEEMFAEIFNRLYRLKNNLVMHYRYADRWYEEDRYRVYELISFTGCRNPKEFHNLTVNAVTNGIENLNKQLIKIKSSEQRQFISIIKRQAYDYRNEIDNGVFGNVKFTGKLGWKLAFDKELQQRLQEELKGFVSAWNEGISELINRILIIENGLSVVKMKTVDDQPVLSFDYLTEKKNFEGEIETLLSALKKNKLLGTDVNKPKLRNVFSVKKIADKVTWTGGIDTLSYFIKQLVKKGKIDKSVDYWKITLTCFSSNGIDLDAIQLKQAKKPAKGKADIIDRIVNKL